MVAAEAIATQTTEASAVGHRVSQRQPGSTANAIARARAAAGSSTTAACTTSGCSGRPAISMPGTLVPDPG